MRVFYRSLAEIKRLSGRAPTKVPATATKLPQEIVEMIINHLIYNKRSLLACSLTCYSWYIAAVPHLHHTLVTALFSRTGKAQWPKPLLHLHRLGLLPLVKTVSIHGCGLDGVTPNRLNLLLLLRFSMLTNIQELQIKYLNIPEFMPRVRHYFGHFLPRVRSLTLMEPIGCNQQILYFIGLFQHLEDLTIRRMSFWGLPEAQVDSMTLTPPFRPPLRGRLIMKFIKRGTLLKGMIKLFGGVRFHYMDLSQVYGMSLLLGACGETLKTLRLRLTDPHGEQLYPKGVEVLTNDFTAISFLREFGLSQNKSLRTLEVTASSIDDALRSGSVDYASSLLGHMVSTVKSPAFFEVIIVYQDHDFCDKGIHHYPFRGMSATEVSWHCSLFEVLRKVQKARDFQLVLCADVQDCVGECLVRLLKEAVAMGKATGVFDDFSSEPVVIYSPRSIPVNYNVELGGWDFSETRYSP